LDIKPSVSRAATAKKQIVQKGIVNALDWEINVVSIVNV
jgi:hypothetical protein